VKRHSTRSQRGDLRECGPRAVQERFRFAMRHQPGIQICSTHRIDFFQGFERWVMLIQFKRAMGLQRGKTAYDSAAGALGKNHAQRSNSSSPV
jgi:hypothetical protein